MKKIFYLYSKSLLSKLALIAILIVGGGNSAWAQKTLPYTYGFETALATEGWTITGNFSSTGISTTFKKTDSSSFLFSGQTNYTQYLISPELANSATGIDVSFYYIAHAYSAGTRNFSIGYSTTDTEISSFTFTEYSVSVPYYTSEEWTQFTASCPTSTKYVAIKYTITTGNLYIDDITIDAQEQYKAPKNLTLNSVTSSTATLSWTNGKDESAWQIAYSTKEDFDPNTEGAKVAVDVNSATITGLFEGVTYYTAVRANYSGNYSNWTGAISFIPFNNTVINDGTYDVSIPIQSSSVSSGSSQSQFVIPSSDLTSIKGCTITKLIFYAITSKTDYQNVSWGNATFEVYLNEVENEKYASAVYNEWGTKVYNAAKLSVSNYLMEITFDTPYTYNDGHLMIGVKQTASGTNGPSNFSWIATSKGYGNNYGIYGSTPSTSYKIPKLTIFTTSPTVSATLGTNGYTTFACPRPLDLTAANLPSGLKAYKAAVDAANSRVNFTEINQTVPANTGMLLEGTAGTTYAIPVADSGTAPEGNDFLVNSTGGTFTADEGYTYYGMKKATSAEDAIVFATFAPATVAIPTNKAYLKVANTPSGLSRQLVCAFSDNTTTAIAEIANRQNGQNSYFNLAGQRVDGSRFTVNGSGLKPGLYIINGKKVVIK